MKKLVTLLLAAGMAWSLSAPSVASAVDVKFSGTMDFSFERRNVNGVEDYGTNQMDALQRLRLAMEFVASESLSGYYMLQVGTGMWGSSSKNSAFGQDFAGGHQSAPGQSRISTRFMYLDWIVPGTQAKVRMGKQSFALPGFAFNGSPATGGVQPGILVSSPVTDNVAVSAFWQRPSANERADYDNKSNRFRNLDIFGVAVPMKFDGFQFAPYIQLASVGNMNMKYNGGAGTYNPGLAGRAPVSQGSSFAWWAGFASKLTMFDPFTASLDFVYGTKNASGAKDSRTFLYTNGGSDDVSENSLADRSGWMAALRMDYKTAYGVPTLLVWYGSGDGKSQTKGGGMMPTTSGNQAGNIGTAATYYDNSWGLGAGRAIGSIAGTWGVSLQWNKFSFVEDLFHDFSVTYFQGTNNKANAYDRTNPGNPYSNAGGYMAYYASVKDNTPYAGYLTTKDSAVDLNLTTTYAIYKNLAANLELGYMFANFDENIRAQYNTDGSIKKGTKPDFNNIWRVAVNFRYTF